MKNSSEAFGAVSLGVVQSLSLWTTLMPPINDVRKNNPGTNPGFAAEMRDAEIIAGGVAILVGVIGSVSMKSYAPVIASSTTVLGLILAYEVTLQRTVNTPTEGNAHV